MAKQTFTTGQVLTAAQMTSLQQTAMLGGDASVKTASYVLVAADAGTTVAMNAAGSTTITVNTGLFSAGDIVFIQNRGVGNCTVTAGTATVSSAGSLILPQNDAGILYFTSASAAIFYDFIQTGATSPLTTKGDIWGYSTSDARIPIGSNGQILTADSTQALGLKWATPASGSTFSGCSLYKSTDQSIANATTTIITFDSENYDVDGYHDNSTNNSRITIPSGKAGKFLFDGCIAWGGNTTGQRSASLYKNGSAIRNLVALAPIQIGTDVSIIPFSTVVDASVGDYFELAGLQDRGAALDAKSGSNRTTFNASYLGA